MTARGRWLGLGAGLVVGLLLPAARSRGAPHRSVLLVSIDSLRADELFAQRAGEAVAPELARLARDSLFFSQAMSAAPWTTPAMTAVMTGLPAPAHGVEEHDRALAASVGTLAERFHAAGYRTAAFVPAITLRSEYGFARGFDTYDFESFGHNRISSPALASKVLARLDASKGAPFFVWVHLWDPHYNYIPQPPYDAMFRRGTRPENGDVQCLKWVENPVTPDEAEFLKSQYEGEIRYTDRFVRQLVDAARRTDPGSIVAILADHGEAFLEKGWLGHTNRVDEALVHVPLLINAPGLVAAGTIREPVTTAALGRTLLDLSGVGGEGFGTFPPLPLTAAGGSSDADEPAIASTVRRGCFLALRRGSLKYVLDFRNCRESLYDVGKDPDESNDLAAARPGDRDRLRARLAAALRDFRKRFPPAGRMPEEIVERSQSRLRSLGYVAGGGADREVRCKLAPMPVGRDSFGDIIVDPPCPEEGALACLEKLSASQGD